MTFILLNRPIFHAYKKIIILLIIIIVIIIVHLHNDTHMYMVPGDDVSDMNFCLRCKHPLSLSQSAYL